MMTALQNQPFAPALNGEQVTFRQHEAANNDSLNSSADDLEEDYVEVETEVALD